MLLLITDILMTSIYNRLRSTLPIMTRFPFHAFCVSDQSINVLRYALFLNGTNLGMIICLARGSTRLVVRYVSVTQIPYTRRENVRIITIFQFRYRINVSNNAISRRLTNSKRSCTVLMKCFSKWEFRSSVPRSNAMARMILNNKTLRVLQTNRTKLINLPSVKVISMIFCRRCIFRLTVRRELIMKRSRSVFNGRVFQQLRTNVGIVRTIISNATRVMIRVGTIVNVRLVIRINTRSNRQALMITRK